MCVQSGLQNTGKVIQNAHPFRLVRYESRPLLERLALRSILPSLDKLSVLEYPVSCCYLVGSMVPGRSSWHAPSASSL